MYQPMLCNTTINTLPWDNIHDSNLHFNLNEMEQCTCGRQFRLVLAEAIDSCQPASVKRWHFIRMAQNLQQGRSVTAAQLLHESEGRHQLRSCFSPASQS